MSESYVGGEYIPFVKGRLGVLPQQNFLIQYVCKSDSNTFEAILSCESNLILQALSYISNAYDSFFETRPLMSVLTTIWTPRWISSGCGIKLATGIVFLNCFGFLWGVQFYTYKLAFHSYEPGQSAAR